ncbi:Hypothetical Protein FCC1311_104352 [Hondaea fermentalgiana]|uniref:Uncharacterized protein n=1 Tax=Hondaea fermentalgiana TaxID=2315210 RepID=A0A2R5H0D5_9STRA|nr:Hypothetical Protein FCC1311_104352 [Hondaea fermentalgiana]|eukprot:GBG34211.1 Hypothetical Protein FCC1311_104352 [Hondaea fermentalgiana]
MVRQSLARKLGSIWSTQHWNFEYKGVLTNHLAHGVVALEHLGAPDARIEDFVAKYEASTPLRDASEARQEEDALGLPPLEEFDSDLVGARKRFFALRDFYQREVDRKGRDVVIRAYLNRLLPGICGALLHNMIHLGYGYRAQVDQTTVEGLAYMHHSYLPLARPQSQHNANSAKADDMHAVSYQEFEAAFLRACDRMRSEDTIPQLLKQRAHEADDFSNSRPQNQLRIISLYAIDDLHELSKDLPLVPSIAWYVDLLCRVFVDTTREQAQDKKSGKAVYSFILLHGVTCSWALHQVEHLVDPAFAQQCLANTLLAVMAVCGVPQLPSSSCPHEAEARNKSWENLLPALREKDLDEHAYKLGAVAYERALSCDANCSPALYKQATQIVTNLRSSL